MSSADNVILFMWIIELYCNVLSLRAAFNFILWPSDVLPFAAYTYHNPHTRHSRLSIWYYTMSLSCYAVFIFLLSLMTIFLAIGKGEPRYHSQQSTVTSSVGWCWLPEFVIVAPSMSDSYPTRLHDIITNRWSAQVTCKKRSWIRNLNKSPTTEVNRRPWGLGADSMSRSAWMLKHFCF